MTRSRSLFVTFLALAIANLVLVNSAGTAGAAANAAFLGPDAGSLALPILQSLTPAHSQYWLNGLSGNSPGGVSPSNCQVGQNNLVHFLPVPYGLDHDVTIECSVARNQRTTPA